MQPYETPSPDLIASIRHQAEKLGYLVAQVETMFADRAKHDRHQITVNHTEESTRALKSWMDGHLTGEEFVAHSADLAELTSSHYDHIKMSYEANIQRLKGIVVESVQAGKNQESELDRVLDNLLGEHDAE